MKNTSSWNIQPEIIPCNSIRDIKLSNVLKQNAVPGGRIYIFTDIRQEAGRFQSSDPERENYISATVDNAGVEIPVAGKIIRTLDLYPEAPEFLHAAVIDLPQTASSNSTVTIDVTRWHTPRRPIGKYGFFMVFDYTGQIAFNAVGYKNYHAFVKETGKALYFGELINSLETPGIKVTGTYPSIPFQNTRKTPGILWGELHGMAFNQRPLDDFYAYAKNNSKLDFCAPLLFSYNTCLGDVWERVMDAADRHNREGSFAAFPGFECGTPPDDSHRCVYFLGDNPVPPIFCETRPPALDPNLLKRLHPAAVICSSLEDFYKTVASYRGIVGGHFHTVSYRQEQIFEIWQKQEFAERYQKAKPHGDEEKNLYEYLSEGKHFGITGGSDTHDSMPGNPYPEPGCPRPAGFTGVWCGTLNRKALFQAFRNRHTFATSGVRMAMDFRCSDSAGTQERGALMGSVLPFFTERHFHVSVSGTAEVERLELIKNGKRIEVWSPETERCEVRYWEKESGNGSDFYLVKAIQSDGHQGWTSPIRIG
jgi:hypothetical protein